MAIKKRVMDVARKGRNFLVRNVVEPSQRVKFRQVFDRLIDQSAAQDFIANGIRKGDPFFVGRLGYTEARAVGEGAFKGGVFSPTSVENMKTLSGFFPTTSDNLQKYTEMTLNDLSLVDMIGHWNTPYQYALLEKYAPNCTITDLGNLEPFFAPNPWTQALEGKRVVAVSPFGVSIPQNYADKKELPFLDRLLPDFELEVVIPPVTYTGSEDGDASWFTEFQKLKRDIDSRDFDVAILGCGAYGFPLAGYLKSTGRSAIHLGGATQLLFGVKGSRWAEREDFSRLFEGSWRPPVSNEFPPGYKRVEGGCYW